MTALQGVIVNSLRTFFRGKPETESSKAKRLQAFSVRLAAAAPLPQRPPSTPPLPLPHLPHSLLLPPLLLFLSVAPHASAELFDPLSWRRPAATTVTRSPTESLWAAPQKRQTQDRFPRGSGRSLLKSEERQPRNSLRLNGSRLQPPRLYMTRLRSKASVRSCPPCLVRFHVVLPVPSPRFKQ